MRALTLVDGQLTLNPDHGEADPGNGDIRVRPIQAGICETDLQLVQGYMGFSGVLGPVSYTHLTLPTICSV